MPLVQIGLLRALDHPNVVKLTDILTPPDLNTWSALCLTFERSEQDIKQLLDSLMGVYGRQEEQFLTPQFVRDSFFQMLLGVAYCHKAGVCSFCIL